MPYVSDEIAYWNQIASFAAAGFDGGYAIVNEKPARVAFLAFGAHGPLFAMAYGFPARLIGWTATSGPVFGAVAVVAAAALWASRVRPPLVWSALLLGSFWPIVLAAPNTMQEPLHFALGCVFAVLLTRFLASPSRGGLATLAVAIGIASMIRPYWGLMAVGVGWHALRHKGVWWAAAAAGAGGLACGALYWSFFAIAAPFPAPARAMLEEFERRPDLVFSIIEHTMRGGVHDWVSLDGAPLELAFRGELAVLVACAVVAAWAARGEDVRRTAAFVSVTGALLWFATVAIGNVGSWQDYRSSTPLILLFLLLGGPAAGRLRWVPVVYHLALLPTAVATFRDFHGGHFEGGRIEAVRQFEQDVRGHLRYDPTVPAWGNTVAVPVDFYRTALLGLPRGMGASAVLNWDGVQFPLRSRYLILQPEYARQLDGRARLRPLAETSLGSLMENEEWR
ncbi:MAG TPA: hypothetical protein VIY56_09985 [Vicinamibacterales bacterium]